MVNDILITRNEILPADELNELFETNNWQIEPVDRLYELLKNTWGYITARTIENKLIGFVQVVSDGIFHAYICRMVVHPDFRKKGIGSMVMAELMKMLNENNLKPTLVATPGNSKFYERFGFRSNCKGLIAMCIR